MKSLSLDLKRSLDSAIGTPLLLVLGPLVRLTGKLLRRDHAIQPVRKILILKFQGMGSLALARPAIQRLKAGFPDAQITLWCTASVGCLAQGMPEFSEIKILNDKNLISAFFSMTKTLISFLRNKIDWAFDLEPYSKISSLLTTLTCARNRAGFAVESVQLRRWVHTHLLLFNRYRFIGDAYLRLFGLLDVNLSLPKEHHSSSWSFSEGNLPDFIRAPYIAIHPHVGDLSQERCWPKNHYSELIQRFLQFNSELHILITGSGDAEIRESASLCIDPRVQSVAGKLTLAQMITLFEKASLVMSSDSGPLHLALSTPAPILALFGPTRPETYLQKNRPLTQVLYKNLYCSPCVHHWQPAPCGGDNQCMKQISVDAVWQASLVLLNHGNSTISAETYDDGKCASSSFYPGLVYERK